MNIAHWFASLFGTTRPRARVPTNGLPESSRSANDEAPDGNGQAGIVGVEGAKAPLRRSSLCDEIEEGRMLAAVRQWSDPPK
jgi:hypothetical protein